jgi:hypothetical protein
MWKIMLAFATVLAIGAATAGSAATCDRCAAGYGYYHAYPKHRGFGFREYYGFYDSGYKASPGGGFHSVVGSYRAYRIGKRRLHTRTYGARARSR